MKARKRASISGLVVVELVSGRRVIVSPDDLPRLGVLPPIASVRLAFAVNAYDLDTLAKVKQRLREKAKVR
jgi:hypothetical protein